MNEKNTTCRFDITEEQLDALAVSFYPVMQEFFCSERGKKLYEEHLEKKFSETKSAA